MKIICKMPEILNLYMANFCLKLCESWLAWVSGQATPIVHFASLLPPFAQNCKVCQSFVSKSQGAHNVDE